MDATEKINKLVQLAVSNSSEHEAAAAALMACRLMVAHDLKVGGQPQLPYNRVRIDDDGNIFIRM